MKDNNRCCWKLQASNEYNLKRQYNVYWTSRNAKKSVSTLLTAKLIFFTSSVTSLNPN